MFAKMISADELLTRAMPGKKAGPIDRGFQAGHRVRHEQSTPAAETSTTRTKSFQTGLFHVAFGAKEGPLLPCLVPVNGPIRADALLI